MGRKRDLVSKTADKISRPALAVSKRRRERFDKSPRLAILMFHHVSDKVAASPEERDLLMTTKEFRDYCEFFRKHFEICTMHEAVRRLNEPAKKPLMVFSFDDGYTDFYETAFPILKELNIPVNQNIIVKYADECQSGYLDWEQIKELQRTGMVEFGSHTFDQHHLIDEKPMAERLSREEIIRDLEKSQKSFLEHLGTRPDILAWPYGAAPKSLGSEDFKQLGICFCLTTASGMNYRSADFYKLKRFAALGYESPEKLDSIIRGYDALGFMMRKN